MEMNGPAYMAATDLARLVAESHGLQLYDLKTHTHAYAFSWPRQVAWWILRRNTRLSFPNIGMVTGGFHHSTVIHGLRKVADAISSDPRIAEQLRGLEYRVLSGKTGAAVKRPPYPYLTREDRLGKVTTEVARLRAEVAELRQMIEGQGRAAA